MKPFYKSDSMTILNLHASKKNRFTHFPEDVRKAVLLKVFVKPYKSVFEFLLENLRCLIYPP